MKVLNRYKSNYHTNYQLPALNLLELVVVIAFIAIVFTAGAQVFMLSTVTIDRSRQATIATLLSQDLLELAISKRNEGWTQLVGGQYHFTEDPDPAIGLVFAPGIETVDEFTRYIQITQVERNSAGTIVPAGTGTVDTNTFLLKASVSWTSNNGINEKVDLYQYVMNWNGF